MQNRLSRLLIILLLLQTLMPEGFLSMGTAHAEAMQPPIPAETGSWTISKHSQTTETGDLVWQVKSPEGPWVTVAGSTLLKDQPLETDVSGDKDTKTWISLVQPVLERMAKVDYALEDIKHLQMKGDIAYMTSTNVPQTLVWVDLKSAEPKLEPLQQFESDIIGMAIEGSSLAVLTSKGIFSVMAITFVEQTKTVQLGTIQSVDLSGTPLFKKESSTSDNGTNTVPLPTNSSTDSTVKEPVGNEGNATVSVKPPVTAKPVVVAPTSSKGGQDIWQFKQPYTALKGVLTFRGDAFRNNSAYGTVKTPVTGLTLKWKASMPASGSIWGGGSGWTGQPLLIQWPNDVKKFMNIDKKYKSDSEFVEVIQASLNGKVYFFDMKTGVATRPPIVIGNAIKGTPSLDPSGKPILYVGDGIDLTKRIGFRLFNLINQKEIHFENGFNKKAPRRWPAFDGSALFTRDGNYLLVAGENGLIYQMKLNAKFDVKTGRLTIAPKIQTINSSYYKGKYVSQARLGMEASLTAYGDKIYVSDNSGYIRCYNSALKEVWRTKNLDDTDASIGLELENGKPVLYTGCEIDHQGKTGMSKIMKLDGLTGKMIWSRSFYGYSLFGESPSNGGMVASPLIGKGKVSDKVFISLCRTPKLTSGLMMALDKKTGKSIWSKEMPTYMWSSPVGVYTASGEMVIVQNDRLGYVNLLKGESGALINRIRVDAYFESTPSVFNDHIVFTSRTGSLYGFVFK